MPHVIVGYHHRLKAVHRQLHAAGVLHCLSGKPCVDKVAFPTELNIKRQTILGVELVVHRGVFDKTDELQKTHSPLTCRFIAAKLSALRQCSILHASAAAISSGTPMEVSQFVNRMCRSYTFSAMSLPFSVRVI